MRLCVCSPYAPGNDDPEARSDEDIGWPRR
ncbi:hypothetical protein K388_06891 [Streptomyces sp. KhCrAH-43]|nr:hypothetical protein K388_06891 [Streptomyces sp. KhCrAH-43]SEE80096.1 hypothetical protein SAMN05216483_6624 [Streptomyces sp. 2131.1]